MNHLLFYSDDYEIMLKFYSDIIASSLFQNTPSFLQKYPDNLLPNYSIVLFLENLTKDIVRYLVLENAQKLNDIKQVISSCMQHLLNIQNLGDQQLTQIIDALSQTLFNRLQEVKTIHLLESISLGSFYLQDVNWKINKIISSSAKSFIGQRTPYLFTLNLYLRTQKQFQRDGLNVRLVCLEMNKIQLKQFLTKLRTIKTQVS